MRGIGGGRTTSIRGAERKEEVGGKCGSSPDRPSRSWSELGTMSVSAYLHVVDVSGFSSPGWLHLQLLAVVSDAGLFALERRQSGHEPSRNLERGV